MARNIKLPDELKGWKIISLISEKKGHNIYRISNKTSDGEKFANLYHIFAYGNDYTNDKARFYADEAEPSDYIDYDLYDNAEDVIENVKNILDMCEVKTEKY